MAAKAIVSQRLKGGMIFKIMGHFIVTVTGHLIKANDTDLNLEENSTVTFYSKLLAGGL